MIDLLFVYGSLRSSFDNEYARLLRAGADLIGEASVRGELRSIGNFPAFVPLGEGTVRGELYRLHDPATILAALDEYEGEDYERAEIQVEGKTAWIYRLRRSPP
jgi:gamma-glutamylcyclotransferase (GGCT)/AIG2-like uncharacterized protein YtfP